jgi:hypothetical protein
MGDPANGEQFIMNEFRHDKEFIAVLSLIIAGKKSKDDVMNLLRKRFRQLQYLYYSPSWAGLGPGTKTEEEIYYE